MELLINLAEKIPPEYGFSAIATALMMLIFYWIVTNPKIIDTANKTLNTRLTETNLYKFIRLAIILAFAFSISVIVLSFLTPVAIRLIQNEKINLENKSLSIALQAKEHFANHEYSEARRLYSKSLEVESPDEATAEEIKGMITATYYGEGLHRDGLKFICSQYKFKPKNSRSYLFAVHAHIRAIAVKEGWETAEDIAKSMRAECDRADFSEFWAHINFGMMEALKDGRSRTSHSYTLTTESQNRLTELIAIKQNNALAKAVALGDYALYFTDRFDELFKLYPNSPFIDIALYDASQLRQPGDIHLLKDIVEHHQNSTLFVAAIGKLVEHYSSLGERNQALQYAALLKERNSVEDVIWHVLKPAQERLDALIRSANFSAALSLTRSMCHDFEKASLPCNFGNNQKKIIQNAIFASKDTSTNKKCIAAFVSIRDGAEADPDGSSKWIHAARTLLEHCSSNSTDQKSNARTLYLLASASRRIGDYKSSLDYLTRFTREISDHPLLDDVLCEIGYHKMAIEGDTAGADAYFQKVIDNFPDQNAYDNALWWQAYNRRTRGDFLGALTNYAKIVALSSKSRFTEWSQEKVFEIEALQDIAPLRGTTFFTKPSSENEVLVQKISETNEFSKKIKRGDRIISICSNKIENTTDIITSAKNVENETECEIRFLRGLTLITFRHFGNSWESSSRVLHPQEISELFDM